MVEPLICLYCLRTEEYYGCLAHNWSWDWLSWNEVSHTYGYKCTSCDEHQTGSSVTTGHTWVWRNGGATTCSTVCSYCNWRAFSQSHIPAFEGPGSWCANCGVML